MDRLSHRRLRRGVSMLTVKAKATVAGRSYEVVFAASLRATTESLQEWGSHVLRERRGIDVWPHQVRIYEV